jgi:hypothetical protein
VIRSKTGIITGVDADIVSIIRIVYKLIISELHKLNFAWYICHFCLEEYVLSHYNFKNLNALKMNWSLQHNLQWAYVRQMINVTMTIRTEYVEVWPSALPV